MVLALNLDRHRRSFENKGCDSGVPTPLFGFEFVAPQTKGHFGKRMAHVADGGQLMLREMVDNAIKAKEPTARDIQILTAVLDTGDDRPVEQEEHRINAWISRIRKHGRYREYLVQIYQGKDGVRWHTVDEVMHSETHRYDMLLRSFRTRAASTVLGAEKVARKKLLTMLSKVQEQHLVTCDGFFERGRSGVEYLIRPNRPTLAIREDRILCALCAHPMGYYERTWTGALPPSDEMIAHLEMIRADEHFFWRKANQIPLRAAHSGI